jgi:hypothetical protein
MTDREVRKVLRVTKAEQAKRAEAIRLREHYALVVYELMAEGESAIRFG